MSTDTPPFSENRRAAEHTLVFDIETAALPLAEAERFMPDFKASGVLKDPAKIAADLADKRADWADRLALNATTSRVLAIGVLQDGLTYTFEGDEAKMLADFWSLAASAIGNGGKLIGFNSESFDLPFLVRRSYLHGVPVPVSVYRGARFCASHLDLMKEWAGPVRDARISLDHLSKFLGVGAKSGSGKDFAALYATDRDAALEYLAQDLRLTRRCAERMGAVATEPTETPTRG